jgi:hypothetical protein
MAEFEVQLSIPTFLTAQLRQLQSQQICLPPPYVFGPLSVQVQKITFGPNSIRHDEDDEFSVFYADSRINPDPPYLTHTLYPAKGFKTQIVQPIVFSLALTSEIMTHPNQAAPIIHEIPLTAVITLLYYPAPMGGCVINRYLEPIEWGSTPDLPAGWGINVDAIKSEVKDLLEARFATPATPFNFADMLPSGVTQMANAGVSVDAGLQRIVFRADPAPGNSYNFLRWTDFYRGAIADHLHGADWSIYIDDKVLESSMTAALDQAMKKSQSGLRLSSLGSQYSNNAGVPRVTTTLHTFIDVPTGDIYLPLQIYTDFSLDANDGTLFIDVYLTDISRLINQIKAAVQALKKHAPLAWLLIDLVAGEEIAQASGVLGTIPTPSITGFKATKISDDHYRFSRQVIVPGFAGARMKLSQMVALPDGVAVTGSMLDRPFTPSDLKMDVSLFGWIAPSFSCGQASESLLDAAMEDPMQVASLYAQVAFNATGRAPIYLCGYEVLNDSLHVFPSAAPGLAANRTLVPCTIAINMAYPPSAYRKAPYDLELLVRTTAGIRYVRIPPPPEMTEEAGNRIVSTIKFLLSYCDREVPKWFDDLGHFNVDWIEDPLLDPPMEMIDSHFWTFEVQGLRPGQTATLLDKRSGAFVHAVAESGIPLTLSMLLPPQQEIVLLRDVSSGDLRSFQSGLRSDGGLETLTMQRSTLREGAPVSEGRRGIDVHRQALLKAASIELGSACQAILPAPIFMNAAVAAVLESEIAAYDLSNPYSPKRIGLWHFPGVKGVRPWRNGLLAFGEEGFTSIAADLTRVPLATGCEPYPILDVAIGPEAIYVLSETALEIRSPGLTTISSIPIEGAKSLCLIGSQLLVGDRKGVGVFDVSDHRNPRGSAGRLDLDLSRLFGSGTRTNTLLAMLSDGASQALTLDDGTLRPSTLYSAVPWFAEGVGIGRAFLRISEDRQRVSVSTLGNARLLVPFIGERPQAL